MILAQLFMNRAVKMAELNRQSATSTSIKRVETYVNSEGFLHASIIEIEAKCEMLQQYWSTFQELSYTLVGSAESEDARKVQEECFAAVEEIYFATSVKLKSRLKELKATERMDGSDPNRRHHETIRLEAIKMPKFDGEPHKWTQFYESFKAMVHDKNYTNIEKLHYLNDSLIGAARGSLGGVTISGEYYNSTWEGLVKRYNNKQRIITSLLDLLYNFEFGNKQFIQSNLIRLVDTTQEVMRGLKSMEIDVKASDVFLCILSQQSWIEKARLHGLYINRRMKFKVLTSCWHLSKADPIH